MGPHGGLRAPRSPVQHMCMCVSASVPVPGAGDIWGGGSRGVCVYICVCVRSRMHELIISNSNDFQRGSESIAQSGDPGGLRFALRTQPRLSGLCSPPGDSAGALRGSRRWGAAEGLFRRRPPSPPVRGTNPSPPSAAPPEPGESERPFVSAVCLH